MNAGRPAAPGVAAGPLVRLDRAMAARPPSGDPECERRDLEAAIREAIASTSALAAKVEGDAADILDFQIAMLEDSVLSAPALERIERGIDAATAWTEAIDMQIADYEATADDYFRARAADLRDIRDRVLRHLAGEGEARPPAGAVLTGEDVTPSRFLSVDWSRGGGIALFAGSPSSHVAMLARSRGVPMVVGLGALDLNGHSLAIIHGDEGRVIFSPNEGDVRELEAARAAGASRAELELAAARKPARTADGMPVSMMINVGDPDELEALDPAICDGVGLVRTEFLFHRAGGLLDEEAQYRAYRRIVEWAKPRRVVFRTLDAGGDKPIEGLTIDGEFEPLPRHARHPPLARASGGLSPSAPRARSRRGAR